MPEAYHGTTLGGDTMSMPVNIDEYCKLITKDDDELREMHTSPIIIERLHRLRGMYAYWLQFPSKFDNEIVEYNMAMFHIGRAQAYDDLHLVQILLGNMQQASKEFIRWKINKDLEADLKRARQANDWRSVAAIEKNRILNNRTDKEDDIEIDYGKIAVQTFSPTNDPRTIGMKKMPGLREYIKKCQDKYFKEAAQEVDYEEIEDGDKE